MAVKFDPNKFMQGKKRKPTICYPDGIPAEDATLWGYYHKESNYYNIVGIDECPVEMGGVTPYSTPQYSTSC